MSSQQEQFLNHLGQRLNQQVTECLEAIVHPQAAAIAIDRQATVQVVMEALSQWVDGDSILFLQWQSARAAFDQQATASLEMEDGRSDRWLITHWTCPDNPLPLPYQIPGQEYFFGLGEFLTEATLTTLREHLPGRSWQVGNDWLLILPSAPFQAHDTSAVQACQVAPLPVTTIRLIERSLKQWQGTLRQIDLLRSIYRQQQDLLAHNHELQQTNRLKSEFLANTSHEIRTPLSSILGFTHLLQAQGYSSTNLRHQEYLNIILTSGQHLLALINDILDLSKIEANQLDLHWETIEVREVCQMALTLVREKASDKGLGLKLEIAPEVTTLIADGLRLKQMLFNLLSNAVKFTLSGTVGIEVCQQDEVLRFSVWDTGIGISQEQQRLLFKPYAQLANSAVTRDEGTGLGLALTQKLAELHGGCIEVRSDLDRGSHFTICLPLTPAVLPDVPLTALIPSPGVAPPIQSLEPPPPPLTQSPTRKPARKRYRSPTQTPLNTPTPKPQRSRRRLPASQPGVGIAQPSSTAIAGSVNHREDRGSGARSLKIVADANEKGGKSSQVHPQTKKRPNHVLLVEDNIHNAKLMLAFLSKSGYEVTWVQDGREMWRTLEQFHPALILMDIHLPEVDGLTLTRQLKQDDRYHTIPVIAQTALAMKGDRDLCLQAGAVDYISKPIDLAGLIELVSKHGGDRGGE